MSLQEQLHRAHKERLLRMSRPPKVEAKQAPEPEPQAKPSPAATYDNLESWVERQKAIPLPEPNGDSWFSIVGDFEGGPTIADITTAVSQYFKIRASELRGPHRIASLNYARQMAFFLCRTHTLRSFPEIGRKFGNRDHTTVLHGFRKIERLAKTDWTVAYDVAHLEAML